VNYQTYAAAIAKKFTRNHQESERLLKFLFNQISHDLARRRRVYFRGFGSFRRIRRPAKKYRNMLTGKIETRPPKPDIDFSPSKRLLKLLVR